jgi:hypothetical protein
MDLPRGPILFFRPFFTNFEPSFSFPFRQILLIFNGSCLMNLS